MSKALMEREGGDDESPDGAKLMETYTQCKCFERAKCIGNKVFACTVHSMPWEAPRDNFDWVNPCQVML